MLVHSHPAVQVSNIMSQALPYHATGKPSYSARADRAQYAEDQCHVGSQTEARPPTDRSPPYGSPNPLRASRPKGQKWKEGNTYHFHVPGPTLPRNRASPVTRQGQAQLIARIRMASNTHPPSVAQATPILQLIGSPSKPPVQRAIPKKKQLVVPGPTLPRNRQAGHSARASSTDGEDQNGEQRPPTHPCCSSHPNPPAHQEPLQASRPKGHS